MLVVPLCFLSLFLSLSIPSRASLVPRVRSKVCGMKIDAIRGWGDEGNRVENVNRDRRKKCGRRPLNEAFE